jgi:glycosyltransferase involved in cell wall biosynthesis
MRIALIGSRDIQQFPTISYGGIETCVENLAWGLHKNNKDFVCIVPKRDVIREYPFEIVESKVSPMSGPEANVWPFAQSLPAIIKSVKPDVIWSQSFWSAEILKTLNIPIICTFHDFVPNAQKKQEWFTFRENTWYRFISRFQCNQWVDPTAEWQRERSFYLHTGLADEEYGFGSEKEREDYYLWVAGLNWGWQIKGLDIFIDLARRNPHRRFVAFGTGNKSMEEELKRLSREIRGFEFHGELKRGRAHQEAFARARMFLMPTRMPEPFGRTILESMSKGTPVLGSTNGALPELIKDGVSGYTANNIDEMERLLEYEFDYARCFEYSKIFHIDAEVEALVRMSEKIIKSGSQTASCPADQGSHRRNTQPSPDLQQSGAIDQSRYNVVQSALNRTGAKTYLEIGVDSGDSFINVHARRKIGVDPLPSLNLINDMLNNSLIEHFRITRASNAGLTELRFDVKPMTSLARLDEAEATQFYYMNSDRFFEEHAPTLFREEKISVAFIDGLHTYAQAYRDVLNVLEHLEDDGIIVMHDCNPPTEASAHPADSWEAASKMNLPGWCGLWCGDVWKTIVHLRATRDDLNIFVLDCDFGVGVISKGKPENRLDLSPNEIGALTFNDLHRRRRAMINLKPQTYLDHFLGRFGA